MAERKFDYEGVREVHSNMQKIIGTAGESETISGILTDADRIMHDELDVCDEALYGDLAKQLLLDWENTSSNFPSFVNNFSDWCQLISASAGDYAQFENEVKGLKEANPLGFASGGITSNYIETSAYSEYDNETAEIMKTLVGPIYELTGADYVDTNYVEIAASNKTWRWVEWGIDIVGIALDVACLGGAFKTAAKAGMTGVKAVAETGAKTAGKEVAEEAAEQAAKQSIKKIGTEAAEDAAEQAAKQAAKQVGKEAAEETAEQAAKQAAKQAGKEVAEEAAEKAGKAASEAAAKEAAAKAAKEAAEKAGKEASEAAAKEAAAKTAREAAEKAAKEAAEQAAKDVVKINPVKVGAKEYTTLTEIWEDIVSGKLTKAEARSIVSQAGLAQDSTIGHNFLADMSNFFKNGTVSSTVTWKQAAEQAAKEASEQAMKEAAETTAKAAAEEAAAKTAREAAEKAAKEATEQAAKAAEEAATANAAKEAAEQAAKAGTEEAAKAGTEQAAKAGTEQAAKSTSKFGAKEAADLNWRVTSAVNKNGTADTMANALVNSFKNYDVNIGELAKESLDKITNPKSVWESIKDVGKNIKNISMKDSIVKNNLETACRRALKKGIVSSRAEFFEAIIKAAGTI